MGSFQVPFSSHSMFRVSPVPGRGLSEVVLTSLSLLGWSGCWHTLLGQDHGVHAAGDTHTLPSLHKRTRMFWLDGTSHLALSPWPGTSIRGLGRMSSPQKERNKQGQSLPACTASSSRSVPLAAFCLVHPTAHPLQSAEEGFRGVQTLGGSPLLFHCI